MTHFFVALFVALYVFGLVFGHIGAGIIALLMAGFTWWSGKKLDETYVKTSEALRSGSETV